jgi:hypothetical protein
MMRSVPKILRERLVLPGEDVIFLSSKAPIGSGVFSIGMRRFSS